MKYILTLLLGAILGAVLALYFFVGTPRAKQALSGAPVQAPEAAGDPPGTAVLTLDEKFFDTLLGTVFHDLEAPAFKLGANSPGATDARIVSAASASTGVRFVAAQAADNNSGQCLNQVVLAPEASGVRTGVKLTNGQVLAPLAFSGSYNLLGNCTNFRGTAQANVALTFDAAQQTLFGQLNVEAVNLENVPVILSGPVTAFVQNAINQKVNPLVLLRGAQLAINLPVQASRGTLKAQAKDVRSEVKDGALRLHVTYDFSGARGGGTAPAPPQS